MNAHEEEELEDLARFCIVLRIPYSEAKHMTQDEQAAFIRAHNKLEEEKSRALKK